MSSLVFLGFSIVSFLISFGIVWLLVPAVLGPFYTALPALVDPGWKAMNQRVVNVIQFITPLAATAGLFVFILKVLMVASVRGRD